MIWITAILKWLDFKKLLIIGLIGAIAFGSVQTCRVKKIAAARDEALTERDQVTGLVLDQKLATLHYINKYNQEVARGKVSELTIGNYKRLVDSKQLGYSKNFALNKKKSNIDGVVSLSAEYKGAVFKVNDSLTFSVPEWMKEKHGSFKLENKVSKPLLRWLVNDEFNHIDGFVLDTPRIRVPIRAALLWERKKFLFLRIGKKQYFMEAYSDNKYVQIDSLTIYKITKKAK